MFSLKEDKIAVDTELSFVYALELSGVLEIFFTICPAQNGHFPLHPPHTGASPY